MINFYVYKVEHGTKKWTDIPYLWKEDVKKKLIEKGYTLNDDGTATKVTEA